MEAFMVTTVVLLVGAMSIISNSTFPPLCGG